MMLKDRNAIVYGAAGGIGRGVARNFAREGARVFLVGRTREKLELVAKEIAADGGAADVAEVDVLDERAVDEHARSVVAMAGSIDVSINLVSHGSEGAGGYVQGVPLVQMHTVDVTRPVTTALTANYLTARAAARQMIEQRCGAIVTVINAGTTHGAPLMGSTGVAAAALESFTHYLAGEVGPSGVRVLGIKIAGVPDSWGTAELHTDVFEADSGGLDRAGIEKVLAEATLLRRVTTLAQVASVATFLASDHAGGMTSTFVNVTGGMVVS